MVGHQWAGLVGHEYFRAGPVNEERFQLLEASAERQLFSFLSFHSILAEQNV